MAACHNHASPTGHRLFVPLLLILVLIAAPSPCRADHGKQNVLILHSYHPELGWTAGINRAMQNVLHETGPELDIHVEYLDTKRNPTPEYMALYGEQVLPEKLVGRHFELILTSDNDAFNYALRQRDRLFHDTPVVFCGVNGFAPEMLRGQTGVTGVAERPDFKNTLETALALHPDAWSVVIIGETQTETGRKNDLQLRGLGTAHPGLVVEFWNDVPLEDLQDKLAQLDRNTIILLASVLADRRGRVYSFAESAELVRLYSSAPLYGSWDFFLGHGIVGGLLTSATAQGEMAARLGLRVLAGEPADRIPVTTAAGNRYMFDDLELRRFGISPERLPPGSILINQPPDFYKLDKWQLWMVIIIILLLCLCLALLGGVMIHRRRSVALVAERARLAALGAEIGRALTQHTSLHGTLQQCVEALLRQTGAVFGRIWIVAEDDPQQLELQASAGLYTRIDGKHRLKRVGELKVGIIASERQPLITNQVLGDPLFTDQDWIAREGILSFAGYPLVTQDKLVGVIAFFGKTRLSESVQATIGSVADMIAVGVERIRAKDALQVALAEAESARDKLDTILRSVADGLVVVNRNRRVVLVNEMAEQLLGISFADTCGRHLDEVLDGKPYRDNILRLFAEPQIETTLDLADAAESTAPVRCLQVRTAPIVSSSQDIGGTVAILRDITRERELDQMKSEFIATAAHELRTPLSTVVGYAELLMADLDQAQFDAVQRGEFLGYILDKSDQLERIIDDLLDLSRIESGRVILLERSRCEMDGLVAEIIQHHQKETDRHRFEVECPAAQIEIDIDRSKMHRVFDNLLSNAVKYSPDGGTIRITGRLEEDWLEVCIADQGIGMSREQSGQAFTKFFRADGSDTAIRGLGLGLTICKGIIEAHGGTIWLDSAPGQGTRVTFRLPLPAADQGRLSPAL